MKLLPFSKKDNKLVAQHDDGTVSMALGERSKSTIQTTII